MHATDNEPEHPEVLVDRALRGELNDIELAELNRHLSGCPECRVELEYIGMFRSSADPRPEDEILDYLAEEITMSRLQDEELNDIAVVKTMSRLQSHEPLVDKVRRLLGLHAGFARRLLPALGAAALVFGLGLAGLITGRHLFSTTPAFESPLSISLNDGSEVTPSNGTTPIQVVEQSADRTRVKLPMGSATFRIKHNRQRLFLVEAGPFQIEDLGTVFRVEHQSDGSIRVGVTEGRVAVLHPGLRTRVELGAGDDRVFVPPQAPETVAAPPPSAAPVFPESQLAEIPQPSRSNGNAKAAEDPTELLRKADLARRSGHPEAAVEPLRRIVKRHTKDPRAPAAAFTLGWLLLTDLGRTQEAAAAFAVAERIALRGALAEDAAARVAEAWQKAGDSKRASETAQRYLRLYPSGRYAALMRGLISER